MNRNDWRSHVPTLGCLACARVRDALCSNLSLVFCSQLPLMNQWKDEFKAHSRVKCPNSGCWLEFPSIYGLKYHYQRCQGVRALAGCLSLPVASSDITIYGLKPLSGLKPQEEAEIKKRRAERSQGQHVRCVQEGLESLQLSVRGGLGRSWAVGNCLEGQKGVTKGLCWCLCQKKPVPSVV